MVIKKVELCIEEELTFGESKLTMSSKKVRGEFFRIFPIALTKDEREKVLPN